jgi:O-antigen ligase
MLIGIGIAMLYAGTRLLFMGRPKPLAGMAVAVLVGAVLFSALPVQERIENRLANAGSSNETRSSLYQQSLESVPESPIFGHGVPKGGDNPNAPPVGTQGQVWMILVSHGPVALFCALGWLVLAIVQSRRRRDLVGLATHTSLLVGTIELLYYGVLPYGLPLLMVAAALALRPADETKETG